MSSKSANYCFANQNNNVGLLLLCEVSAPMLGFYHYSNIVFHVWLRFDAAGLTVHALLCVCVCVRRSLWETVMSCWMPTTRPAICLQENTAPRAWDRLDLTPKTQSCCESVFIWQIHFQTAASCYTTKIITMSDRKRGKVVIYTSLTNYIPELFTFC